jgi:hypothetical protein
MRPIGPPVDATASANEVEDRRSFVAHLKGRALCINVVGYLGPLTIAIASGSNSWDVILA